MEWLKRNWFPIIVVLLALLAVAGTFIYHQHAMLKQQKENQTYERQLRGELSEKERRMQSLDADLGLAKAKLVPIEELERKYKAQLDDRDKAMEQFRKDHDLQVKALTDALFSLDNTTHGGKTTVVIHDPAPQCPDVPQTNPSQPADPTCHCGPIEYTFTDQYARAHLVDPDIFTPDNEEFTLKQNFKLKVILFQQQNGQLQTQQTTLTEVVPDGDSYKPIGEAKLIDAEFTYSNPPAKTPKRTGVDMSIMASVGSTFAAEHPLVFGGAINLFRYKSFGVAAGIVSDFTSRAGTSPTAFLTYRPRIAGRDLNLMIGAGAAFPLGGSNRVVPAASANFIVW